MGIGGLTKDVPTTGMMTEQQYTDSQPKWGSCKDAHMPLGIDYSGIISSLLQKTIANAGEELRENFQFLIRRHCREKADTKSTEKKLGFNAAAPTAG
jgi:hypothetical protein